MADVEGVLPKAQKKAAKADIVFCVDATGSMAPCISGLKKSIGQFVEGLRSAADLDFRLRLIGYRDLHDRTCATPWVRTEFTRDINEFSRVLFELEAEGGGTYRGAESSLDALYMAIHSQWREERELKCILLFSDDNTHTTLHPSTYSRPDNGLPRVVQDAQTLKHGLFYLMVPEYDAYVELERSLQRARRRIILWPVPKYENTAEQESRLAGLANVEFEAVMRWLGDLISESSTE